ncbi:MAG: hypothetical protein H6855_01700 [Rhodospirillales bacterium]|nr:hypothetical protein [Rhodospirillales bacterium]MCB9973828.1 hypothetical protein [Rhodospirillales bacterium]
MTFLDVATLFAIVIGPVIGVFTARLLDGWREKKDRRWNIFVTLMRTRNIRLCAEHVGALNLVEVEFADKKGVISAWKNYRKELSPSNDDGVGARRNNTFTKLLDEMAKVMGIKIEQLDILEGNYIPQGWQDQEDQNSFIRSQMIKVLQGQGAVPISVIPNVFNQSLFPPAPTSQDDED